MAAWLIAAIERIPPRARGMVVSLTAVVLLAGAITSLTLEAGPGGGARRRTPVAPRRPTPAPAHSLTPPVIPQMSATELHAARVVAAQFLVSYLRFAYGRASAGSVSAITRELRGQLTRGRAQVTPVERRRHPRVVSLQLVGTTPRFVVATATVADGGVALYRLRFSLQENAGRSLVGAVWEG
jgi:hypothetical protein